MKKYLPIIKEVLEESETSRSNDRVLVYYVYEKINTNIPAMSYAAVMRRVENKELPCADTVTRIGRKLKKENPELEGDKAKRVIYKQQKCKQDLGYDN